MFRTFVVLMLWTPALAAQQDSLRVDVRYRVTPTCEITDVRAIRSDRFSAALAETAVRLLRTRLQSDAPVGASVQVLTDDEAQAALAKYRAENPDKYHSRVISVQLSDSTSGTLTCFF